MNDSCKETQTELFDTFDFSDVGVNLASLFSFDPKSTRMYKVVVEGKGQLRFLEYLPKIEEEEKPQSVDLSPRSPLRKSGK